MAIDEPFLWSRFPDDVCIALAEAAEPDEEFSGADARRWLRRVAAEPAIEFLEEGEQGATVAHAFRDVLPNVGSYALERAYAKAVAADLVRVRGKTPGARGQAQRLRACRVTKQFRQLLLEVLWDTGRPFVAEGGSRRLASLMLLRTDEASVGRPLLEHQRRVTTDLTTRWERDRLDTRGLLVMPTGAGKTRVAVDWLLVGPVAAGVRVLWITHSIHLLEQTAGAFIDRAPICARPEPLGLRLIGGGFGTGKTIASAEHDIVIATVQSLYPKATFDNVRSWMSKNEVVVVFDEAHRAVAPTWMRLVQMATTETGDAVIGLTATPVRLGAGQTSTLGRLFGATGDSMDEAIISEVAFDELVEQGVLARPTTHTVSTEFDIDGLLTAKDRAEISGFGDFSQRVLGQLVKQAPRNRSIIETYLGGPDGSAETDFGRTIVYAVNIAHAETLAALFDHEGVACEAVHTRRARDENREALRRFREGSLKVLVNVQMLTEGIDVPNADAVFLTRPTLSLSLFSQMVGRALRGPKMGGTARAHIVDFQDLLGEFTTWRVTFASLGLVDESPSGPSPAAAPQLLEPYALEPLVALAVSLGEEHPLPVGERFQRIPVGYYLIGVDPPRADAFAEARAQTLLVFDHEFDGYERIASEVSNGRAGDLPTGSWTTFFDDLPHPHPADQGLSTLRDFVLSTGTMPTYVRLDVRDSLDPRAVAKEIVDRGGRNYDELSKATRGAYQSHPSVIDRVWGGRDEFGHDVREEWVRILEGRPVPLEDRRIRVPLVLPPEKWTYRNGALDLAAIVESLLGDRDLFPTPLPRPPSSVSWSEGPMRDWALYRWDEEDIKVNVLLDSRDLERPELVGFLLFHELLHHEQRVVLGLAPDAPDSVVHGDAFYEREHSYPDFAELDAFMDDFRRRFDYIE